MEPIKISELKVMKYGTKGFSISLPKVYVHDNKIKNGDVVEVFRGIVGGKDVLIIKKKETPKD